MPTLLFVVEDAFRARGPGVLLMPRVTTDAVPGDTRAFSVRLRAMNGEERVARASLDVAHGRGPLAPYAMVRLIDEADPAAIAPGTEVWLDDA